MDYFKAFLDWIGRWQVVQSLLPILKPIWLPVMMAGAAGGAGYLQHVQWIWVITLTCLTFMGVMVGLFFASTYSSVRTPAHKLRYMTTVVAVDLGAPPNRKTGRAGQATTGSSGIVQAYLDKGQIGVQLQNAANFPISAFVAAATTKLTDKEPPRTTYPKDAVTISPGNTVNMMDMPIEMKSFPCGKMEGFMDMKIKYGRRGKETYELAFKAKIEVFMRKDGLMQFISTQWESNRLDAIGPPA